MGVEVADGPAAAVEIDQHRQCGGVARGRAGAAERAIQAQRNRPARALAARVAHRSDLGRRRLGEAAPVAIEDARVDRRQRVHRRQAALGDEVDQGPGLRMKHRLSSESSDKAQ